MLGVGCGTQAEQALIERGALLNAQTCWIQREPLGTWRVYKVYAGHDECGGVVGVSWVVNILGKADAENGA